MGVDGEKDAAVFDAAFIALGFVLRNSHADESSGNAADGSADARARECRHDGTCGNERPKARDGNGADTQQPSHGAAENCAGAGASGRAFRSLRVFLVGKVASARVLREQGRDVSVAEACFAQSVHADLDCCVGRVDAEYCGIFSSHGEFSLD